MKHFNQLVYAIRWWRLGISFRKAWTLAAHSVRKHGAWVDLCIILTVLMAYVVVTWNDEIESVRKLTVLGPNHWQRSLMRLAIEKSQTPLNGFGSSAPLR